MAFEANSRDPVADSASASAARTSVGETNEAASIVLAYVPRSYNRALSTGNETEELGAENEPVSTYIPTGYDASSREELMQELAVEDSASVQASGLDMNGNISRMSANTDRQMESYLPTGDPARQRDHFKRELPAGRDTNRSRMSVARAETPQQRRVGHTFSV